MFREASWDRHDFNYYVWWTESDRIKADQWFFLRLVKDSLKTWYLQVYYLPISIIFYLSVRIFGGKYFKYK